MSSDESETWVTAVGDYQYRYEVSSLGRVRKLEHVSIRKSGVALNYAQKIILSRVNNDGYTSVSLRGKDGKLHSTCVHRIVALSFLGAPQTGFEVRHRDGNRQNPRLSNLHYGTRRQNTLDSVAHGTHAQSRKTHCAQGHEFTDENTYRIPTRPNSRICRICKVRSRTPRVDEGDSGANPPSRRGQ